MITAATAIAAVLFTGRSLQATQQQFELSRQSQVADRFAKALDELGSAMANTRLGGIYSLEQLSRDAPAEQPRIVEVVSAFIRTQAPTRHPVKPPYPAPPAEGFRSTCPNPDAVAADVQAALTVLARRNPAHDGPGRINLSFTCLTGADLASARLARANLYGAALAAADLHRADLFNVDLSGATLTSSNLMQANLAEAGFWRADLSGCILAGANLSRAKLQMANLTDAHVQGADLSGAGLTDSNLTGAHLTTGFPVLNDVYLPPPDKKPFPNVRYNQNTMWPDGFIPPTSG